jgi:hypothetical protein
VLQPAVVGNATGDPSSAIELWSSLQWAKPWKYSSSGGSAMSIQGFVVLRKQ